MTKQHRSTEIAGVVRAGFIPLVDAAPLIVASRLGFANAEGLGIELVRETSWATLRDRLAVRHLDVAHMLAPMPIADSLGLTPLPVGLLAPMALGFGGNTITVSAALWAELGEHGIEPGLDPAQGARAFARVVADRRRRGVPPPTLAIVHPYSAHHYQLAYWLAWAGIRPGRDLELVVVPPPLMTAALSSAQIDGFCAGEPWGSAAASEGVGRIVTTSAHIWRRSPEKVLGVRRHFANEDPDRLSRLLRAVQAAACWCDQPEHHSDLAHLLARPDLVGLPAEIIHAGLARRMTEASGDTACRSSFLAFAADAGTFPWTSHAAWFYAQMVRWKQVPFTTEGVAAAQASYRPDLYRAALSTGSTDMPAVDSRIEGAAATDAFFDGRTFDPEQIKAYLRDLEGHPN